MSVGIPEALISLRPNAQWSVGQTYESIVWLDTQQSKPSKAEVEAEIARLQVIYDNNEYQRLRSKAYPPFEEQLDILYHQGYDGWKAAITAIKDMYPKPQ